jgi:hypothetical protein
METRGAPNSELSINQELPVKTSRIAGKSSKLTIRKLTPITKCTQTPMQVCKENGLLVTDEPVESENKQLELKISGKLPIVFEESMKYISI